MSNQANTIFSRAFVALYVLYGYLRHYMSRISMRSFVAGILVFALLFGYGINLFLTPKLSGNDALNRGLDLRNEGRFNAAHDAFEQAYQIFREEGYGRGEYITLRHLGETDLIRSNPQEALFHFDQALRLAQNYNDLDAQISLFIKHADIKLRLNRFDAARAHLYDALKIAQDAGKNNDVGMLFTRVGNLERDIGNDRRARFLYRQAMESYLAEKNINGEANLRWNIAILESGLENYQNAINGYLAARELYKTGNDTYGEANVLRDMARLEKKLGSERMAATYYNEAATLYASIGRTNDVNALKNEAAELLL